MTGNNKNARSIALNLNPYRIVDNSISCGNGLNKIIYIECLSTM